jgi:periplasmic divalent cation tolerance protein
MEQARLILCTTSSRDEAQRIARALVEQHLAACVNIVEGVTSVYRWQGTVEESSELLLIIKSNTEKLKALEAAIHKLHSYDVPEFLVLPIESGSHPYLAWLHESIR